MTLKSSYSNLNKENRKRVLGINLVIVLALFVKVVVVIMAMKDCETNNEIVKLVAPNMPVAGVIVALAAGSAAASFCYLHSRKQMDFYGSLPVKRTVLFRSAVQNSILTFLAALVVEEAVELCAAAGYKVFASSIAAATSSAFWYFMVFVTTYLTMTLAMIMTGNIIVGMLGFGVFASYFPLVLYMLYPLYAGTFFTTYTENATGICSAVMKHLSPVYVALADTWYARVERKVELMQLLILAVWIIALYILCKVLYNRRPAESAGRAMAFPKANTVIKLLLTIPASLYVGIMFYELGGNAGFWLVFGVIFGALIVHAVIECIYEFDIRAIFHHKQHLAVALFASLFITLIFSKDLFGYDRYVPKASAVESVDVRPSDISGIGICGKTGEGLTGKEKNLALKLISEVVKDNDKKEASDKIYIDVKYCMKNGSNKLRAYSIQSKKAKEIFDKLYATRAFKSNIYNIYTGDYNDIIEVSYSGVEPEYLNFTKEEKKEFFDIYLSEFDQLTYTERVKEIPIGTIDLTIGEENGDTVGDMYYLYPSFKKTIAYLKEKGYAVDKRIKDLDITSIEVSFFDEEKEEDATYTISDKKSINRMKNRLYLYSMTSVSETTALNSYINIQVNYKSKNGVKSIDCATSYTEEEIKKLID